MRVSLVQPVILFATLFLAQGVAYAQVDPSSQVLLEPTIDRAPQEAGLQSGRYQVKKSTATTTTTATGDEMQVRLVKKNQKSPQQLPTKKVKGTEVQDASVQQSMVVTVDSGKDSALAQSLFSPTATPRPKVEPTPAPATTTSTTTSTTLPATVQKTAPAKPATAPAVVATPTAVATPQASAETVVPEELPEPNLFDKPAVDAYKEQVHYDDIRLNQIEVTVLPGLLYNDSSSSYSYRDYMSFSPSLQMGGQFWVTPFLGAYGNYTTSMGADVVSDATTNSRIPANHEWTEVGLDVRKFFGMSRKASSLEFGIHYAEYKFTVPGDNTHRARLKSSGFGFHLMTRVPTAPNYAWIFGGKIQPRINHSEHATGLSLQSGSSPESSRITLELGGEFKLSRQNQVIWGLSVGFEKNQFVGPASQPDPETGATPSGVSIQNTFTGFSMGYRWGQ